MSACTYTMKKIFLQLNLTKKYLVIRPVARKGYGSIAHEAKPNGLLTLDGSIGLLALDGEGSNCFSITQLVGQKKAIIKLVNAS